VTSLRTVHRLEPAAGGRTRIIYRTEITGLAADQAGPELGPAITADFPRFSPVWRSWREASRAARSR
jgi:hypothetical protein